MIVVSDELRVRLTNLMFVSTLLILLMHLGVSGVSPRFLHHREVISLTHLAVPLFFAMSGFFLARHCEVKSWYATAVKKRFWTLVIPYFAVCTLYAIPLFFYQNILHAGNWPGGGLGFDWYTIKRVYGLTPEFHPSCGPFWYIRCLVFFVVMSPLFAWFIRKSRGVAVSFWTVLMLKHRHSDIRM